MKSSLRRETASARAAFFDDLVVLVFRNKLDQTVKPGLHGDLEQASVFGGDVQRLPGCYPSLDLVQPSGAAQTDKLFGVLRCSCDGGVGHIESDRGLTAPSIACAGEGLTPCATLFQKQSSN